MAGQTYEHTSGRSDLATGPAFLVYYSPAFLRSAARTNALSGLQMLAEIYRQARSLWASSAALAGQSVTVRIDQIKELPPETIMDAHAWGDAWVLVKQNSLEGVVKPHSFYSIGGDAEEVNSLGEAKRLLTFWWRDVADGDADGEAPFADDYDELEMMRRRLEEESVSTDEAQTDAGISTDSHARFEPRHVSITDGISPPGFAARKKQYV